MSQEPNYVGIDVSKERVDVAVLPNGRSWSVSYDGAGVDDLVAQLKDLGAGGSDYGVHRRSGTPPRSSSGRGISTCCCRQPPPGAGLAGLPPLTEILIKAAQFAVVAYHRPSTHVQGTFAKSTGQLAKTDRLDAQVLDTPHPALRGGGASADAAPAGQRHAGAVIRKYLSVS